MSKRAVIYARVSTDMQRDNFSIPSQISECLKYSQEHKYTLLGNQYVDVITGHDTSAGNNSIPAFVDDYSSRELSRPGLDASLAYLETYGFDVLIVHALDRLARDPYIRQTLEREFNSRGARIEYVLGSYEETPEGEVRKDLDATFAKWENAKRVERCNRGKRRKAEGGKYVSGIAPFGYRLDPDARGGLAVIQEQAKVVQKIFTLYGEERLSIRSISRILTEDGVPPLRNGEQWAKSSIHHILENTTYVGYFYYNKNKHVGTRLEPKPHQEWIRVECDPIVDQAIFEIVRSILEKNRRHVRKTPIRFYMLSGMVFCSECERPYQAQTQLPSKHRSADGRKKRKYQSQSYRHRVVSGHCMNRQVSAKVLEQLVWEKTHAILLDPVSLREGYEQSLEQQMVSIDKKRAHIETLDRALRKNRQKRQNLNTAYLDPEIEMSKHEFLEQKSLIDSEGKSIEEELASHRRDLENIPTPADINTLEMFASEIAKGLLAKEELTPQRKRQILELMHMKVILFPDGRIRLDGWFNASEIEGLSSITSTHCAHRRRPLRAPA